MKFGLFYLPTYLPDVKDAGTHFDNIAEQVVFADQAGIEYCWMVEHHFVRHGGLCAGKMRPLAVTGQQPSPALPDVPTFAEAGYPAVEGEIWQGIFGPAGLPEAIVRRLNHIIVQGVASKDFQERSLGVGIEPVQGTPQALAAELARDIPRWQRIVAETGAKPQ